jgi:hypothetical protein
MAGGVSKQKRKKRPLYTKVLAALNLRRKNFLARRPHRSFRKTARRDYKRSFTLPGYWSFTNQVRLLLMRDKSLFIKFIFLYSALSWLVFGIMSQENYVLLNQTIHSVGDNIAQGQLNDLSLNFAIFSGVLSGVFNGQLTPTQQVYGGLFFLLSWLTIVWLLRQSLAGHKNIRLRDGLYFSGSPVVPTFLLFMVVLVQLIPFVVALVAYFTADSLNVLGVPILSIMFWLFELLLVVMSLYWLSSSFIALIVVTLPGMYPLKALKVAGDLVIGRRLRILYRLMWLGLSLGLVWLLVLLPVIALANMANIEWLPLVPLIVLLLGSTSIVWVSAYIYLLYRKLVDDGASPA